MNGVCPDGDPSGAYSSLLFVWGRTNTLLDPNRRWKDGRVDKILLNMVMQIIGKTKWNRTHKIEEPLSDVTEMSLVV